MERTEGLGRRLRAAWAVVRGAAPGEAADAGASAAAQARIANLEMDVQERDERIERLRAEFVLQARQSDEAVARAGTGQLQSLAKRAAPLLSQLTTIQTMAEGGRDVRTADILKLAGKLKQLFVDAGLEPIGRPGQICSFDAQIHQRMSGGDVRDGDEVKVRFEGHRLGEAIIAKAMISREGTE